MWQGVTTREKPHCTIYFRRDQVINVELYGRPPEKKRNSTDWIQNNECLQSQMEQSVWNVVYIHHSKTQ